MPVVTTKAIEFLKKKDKVIAGIIDQYGTPPNWQNEEGFESLSKIILGQQVSLESADAHFAKLKSYIGEFIPENILKLSDQEMHDCYISRQKAKYIRGLSEAVISGELNFEKLRKLPVEQIREKLLALKGIGNWTTNIYLMFCLQLPNVFPLGDIAVINTMKELYGVKDEEGAITKSEIWNPHKTLGSYFMWFYYLKKRGRENVI